MNGRKIARWIVAHADQAEAAEGLMSGKNNDWKGFRFPSGLEVVISDDFVYAGPYALRSPTSSLTMWKQAPYPFAPARRICRALRRAGHDVKPKPVLSDEWKVLLP